MKGPGCFPGLACSKDGPGLLGLQTAASSTGSPGCNSGLGGSECVRSQALGQTWGLDVGSFLPLLTALGLPAPLTLSTRWDPWQDCGALVLATSL